MEPGHWSIPTKTRAPPRWVLAVRGKLVLYSTGGSRHRECLVTTFKRWARRTEAKQDLQ